MDAIIFTLNGFNIKPFVFVDHYDFDLSEERQMMQQAMKDIGHCDLLLAEVSEKAIGVGIEVGYAKAKEKPVIYLCQRNAPHSTTGSGISDFQIVYESTNELQLQLSETITRIVQNNLINKPILP